MGAAKAQFEIGPVATLLAADESLLGQFVQVRVGQPHCGQGRIVGQAGPPVKG